MEVKKLCKMQDSGLKRVPYNSGETSINLSNDVVEILLGNTIIRPSNISVKLRLYKSDFIRGVCYIISQLPLYNSSSQGYKKVEFSMDLYNKYLANINEFFENREFKDYECNILLRKDGRNYLNDLKKGDFSIRDFLVENSSQITYGSSDDGVKYLRISYMNPIAETKKQGRLLISDKTHCKFALKCMTYFYNSPKWNNIDNYVEDFKEGDSIKVSNGQKFSLTGMFIYVSEDELIERNNPRRRWYTEPFNIKGKTVYLSTEWYPGGNEDKTYSLEIPKLGKLISTCFGSQYKIIKNDMTWELWELSNENKERITNSDSDNKTDNTPDTQSKHPFSISRMISLISETGLLYSPDLIKRFAFSLMSKRFLILSGLAGSGKTQLALAFANALIEDDSQLCVVPVGADWTNREPLLGFPNALQKGLYVKPESGVLDLLIEANKQENKAKPYFLVLDEMNMSYVERYFADFLSSMESHKAIPLWKGISDDVPQAIGLPNNLFIVGTINVDETTYMFSPKVLDRANVIEFKISLDEMERFLIDMKPIDRDSINHKAADMGASFVSIAESKDLADDKEIKETLTSFFKNLKSVNSEFGYRSATEIYRFAHHAQKNDDTETKMTLAEIVDCAIVQKLLPKLHGSRKKLDKTLNTLWRECFEGDAQKETTGISPDQVDKAKYKLTADKIQRMYEAAMVNGFTSFSEA